MSGFEDIDGRSPEESETEETEWIEEGDPEGGGRGGEEAGVGS